MKVRTTKKSRFQLFTLFFLFLNYECGFKSVVSKIVISSYFQEECALLQNLKPIDFYRLKVYVKIFLIISSWPSVCVPVHLSQSRKIWSLINLGSPASLLCYWGIFVEHSCRQGLQEKVGRAYVLSCCTETWDNILRAVFFWFLIFSDLHYIILNDWGSFKN